MPVFFPYLLLTYPLVLHLSIHFGHPGRAVIYLALLLSIPFISALIRRSHPGFWHLLALVLAGFLLFIAAENEHTAVKLVPLSINAVLLWLFASSLLPDRVPLVTRFAGLMRDDMPPAVLHYTRRATIAWAIYFLFMLVLSSLLAWFAPIELWSLFSNILSYVLLVLMFLLEFFVRRMLVKEHMDYSFSEFVRRLRNVDFQQVFRQ